jgi:hypothetical protein
MDNNANGSDNDKGNEKVKVKGTPKAKAKIAVKEKPKIRNSPNNSVIRTKLYDGKVVCSSRECCNHVDRKKSIYCRDKCEVCCEIVCIILGVFLHV